MSSSAVLPGHLSFFHNTQADVKRAYGTQRQAILSVSKAKKALATISSWPNYQATELHRLTGMAAQANVGQIYYKDESTRFGLKSFKALAKAFFLLIPSCTNKGSITVSPTLRRGFSADIGS